MKVTDDEELLLENEGGGGPHSKNYKYGPVVQNVEEYHRQLLQDCQKSSEEIHDQIEKGLLQNHI